MPIYEYRCHKCGTFEVTQRITEAPLKKCPTCKGKVERLISATSFVLKGSGWYATDYAHGNNSAAANHKGTEGSSDSGDASKTSGSDGASKNGTAESVSAAPAEKSSAGKTAD